MRCDKKLSTRLSPVLSMLLRISLLPSILHLGDYTSVLIITLSQSYFSSLSSGKRHDTSFMKKLMYLARDFNPTFICYYSAKSTTLK